MSDDGGVKMRVVPIEQIQRYLVKQLPQAILSVAKSQRELGYHQSCLSCCSFEERIEGCKISGNQRPPARIIAFGCTHYTDVDDIPF